MELSLLLLNLVIDLQQSKAIATFNNIKDNKPLKPIL